MDCQQITIVMLIHCQILSVKYKPPYLTPQLLLMDNIKLDGIPTNINEKYMPALHLIFQVFQVLRFFL